MYRKIYIPLCCIMLLLQGCITDYSPSGIEEEKDLLIVEGAITNDQSVIKISRSIGLTESFTGDEIINNAKVWIERNDGFNSEYATSDGNGVYAIQTGELEPGKEYRLNISLDGEEYQSAFLSPLFTPEIDSLSWTKAGQGHPVFMRVSTHDPLNQSKYYRWAYKEIWEVKADLYANVREEGGKIIEFDLQTSNNIFYCWGRDSSKILHLDSSEKLKENVISQKKLVEIPPSHDKLSVLYYFAVEQYMIRKDAYDYFYNLQKNIESGSSIFSPVPSEMRGNIKCITTPDIPVIGYIDVSTKTTKEIFVDSSEGLYEPKRSACFSQITDDPDEAMGLVLFYMERGVPPSYAPLTCVDCNTKEKANKNRPSFWPNNDY